jgi:hypothetical protein
MLTILKLLSIVCFQTFLNIFLAGTQTAREEAGVRYESFKAVQLFSCRYLARAHKAPVARKSIVFHSRAGHKNVQDAAFCPYLAKSTGATATVQEPLTFLAYNMPLGIS